MGDSFGLLSSWDTPVTDRIADISNHLSDWTALYSLGSPVCIPLIFHFPLNNLSCSG